MSKKQLTKLGEQIAAGEPPANADLLLLTQVLRAYQTVLVTVEEQLTVIGLPATSRVKTIGVLIEKLRREEGMALARVQDTAGARTVVDGGWVEQDAVVDRLRSHFDTWTGKPSRVVDRRSNPSHGYRAVHVVVFPEGVPVEIQVRTELQNYWAQIVERLADRWGRGVRYGDDPTGADLPAEGVVYPDGSTVTRKRLIDDLRRVADQAADIEETERIIHEGLQKPTSLEERITTTLGRRIEDLDADAVRFYPRLRVKFKRVVSMLSNDEDLSGPHKTLSDRRRVGRLVRRTVPDVVAPDADFVEQKLRACDSFVGDVVAENQSHLKQQQATLLGALRSIAAFVDKGGIR